MHSSRGRFTAPGRPSRSPSPPPTHGVLRQQQQQREQEKTTTAVARRPCGRRASQSQSATARGALAAADRGPRSLRAWHSASCPSGPGCPRAKRSSPRSRSAAGLARRAGGGVGWIVGERQDRFTGSIHPGRKNSTRTSDDNLSSVEAFALGVVHVGIVLAHDGHDRQLGLDGEVERALFERQERRDRARGPGPLGKDEERELPRARESGVSQSPGGKARPRAAPRADSPTCASSRWRLWQTP